MSARKFELHGSKTRFGNVTVNRAATRIAVQLHWTEVVVIEPGVITLNSGGWRTNTTKTAINTALSKALNGLGCVVQRKGAWFVEDRAGRSLPFEDGMKLYV